MPHGQPGAQEQNTEIYSDDDKRNDWQPVLVRRFNRRLCPRFDDGKVYKLTAVCRCLYAESNVAAVGIFARESSSIIERDRRRPLWVDSFKSVDIKTGFLENCRPIKFAMAVMGSSNRAGTPANDKSRPLVSSLISAIPGTVFGGSQLVIFRLLTGTSGSGLDRYKKAIVAG